MRNSFQLKDVKTIKNIVVDSVIKEPNTKDFSQEEKRPEILGISRASFVKHHLYIRVAALDIVQTNVE